FREVEAPAEPAVSARPEPRPPEIAEAKPRTRIGEQPALAIPAATGEEVEVAWHGYSAAALIPSTIVLAAFAASVFVLVVPLVTQTVVRKAFGIGTVRVFRETGTAAAELPGVRRPKALASQIEAAATAAREANVTAGRLRQSNR